MVWSSVTYNLTGTNVENLNLVGTNIIDGFGNDQNNILRSDGNININALFGGEGNDTYYVDHSDTVNEGVGEGIDTINLITNIATPSLFSYALAVNVENLNVIGIKAITAIGNDLANIMRSDGNLAGGNTFDGGRGNDTYYVKVSDSVSENLDNVTQGGGNDTVNVVTDASTPTGSNFQLGAANLIENLNIIGTKAINAEGDDLANIMRSDGNLAGGNTLDGLRGDDTYYVKVTDMVAENLDNLTQGGGNDTVNVVTDASTAPGSIFKLGPTNLIENLNVIGIKAIIAEGDDLDNVMRTVGANLTDITLSNIASGNTLNGLRGDDTYYVKVTDMVAENLDNLTQGGGNDTVNVVADINNLFFTSFNLGAGNMIENLNVVGIVALTAIGDDLANTMRTVGTDITNITLSNIASGNTLDGLKGDDTYYIKVTDSASEQFDNLQGGGMDTVHVFADPSLPGSNSFALGLNIEAFILEGTANLNGTGNELNNMITGNSGNNTLAGNDGNDIINGGGGIDIIIGGNGADTLTGGLGGDTFTYSTTLESGTTVSTRDVITDFHDHLFPGSFSENDHIDLTSLHLASQDYFAVTNDGTNTTLSVYNSATDHSTAVMQIELIGVHNLSYSTVGGTDIIF